MMRSSWHPMLTEIQWYCCMWGWGTLKRSTMTKPCPHLHRNSIWYFCYLLDGITVRKCHFQKSRLNYDVTWVDWKYSSVFNRGRAWVYEPDSCCFAPLWKQCVLNSSRHIDRGCLWDCFILRWCQLQLVERTYEPSVIRRPQGIQTGMLQRWWTHGECERLYGFTMALFQGQFGKDTYLMFRPVLMISCQYKFRTAIMFQVFF